ncbi:CD63 antigen-like [Chrysoperla carnea]|uniref:CD63 antigen-like n=1 Tax=Chrysoperla carnea TaxID=189513 RepID=UPI001D0796BD|nr:CD63 antigen-like [Chrysoperla carnea]
MGCVCELATSVVRLVLFVFNFLLVVSGIAFITLGVVYKNDADKVLEVSDSDVAVAPIFCIVLGSIIFIISFFGCWGAFNKNTCMLRTYAILCGIILILGIVVCVYAFKVVDNDDITKSIRTSFDEMIKKYDNDKDSRIVVDNIQSYFKCCGSTSPADYKNNTLPNSCCGISNSDKAEQCKLGQDNVYTGGCVKLLSDAINTIGTVLGWVAIVIGLILCTGIFFGLCLSCRN